LIVLPTVFAMGLAGIWHGAGLQFLIFGLLHAGYLAINHAWRIFRGGPMAAARRKSNWLQHVGYLMLTFAAVLVAQAFFRADGVAQAWQLVQGMAGVRGWESMESLGYLAGMGVADGWRLLAGHHVQLLYVAVLLAIVWLAPNAHQIMGVYSPALAKPDPAPRTWMRWQPNFQWLLVMLCLLALCLLNLHKESRFLYFQF